MKLFLIAGHGEGDPGAEGGGYTEAERVRALAERMKYYGGDNVIIGDTSKNWYRHGYVSTYNFPYGCCVMELHMDAGGGQAHGGHIIVKNGLGTDQYDRAVATYISGILPGRSENIKYRDDLANINRAAKRGINYRLLECGFIDNDSDREKFNSNIDEIAINLLACFGIISQNGTGKWVKDETGYWWKEYDGSYPKSSWKKIAGVFYWFNERGYCVMNDWILYQNHFYFLGETGGMTTGWKKIGEDWYYFNQTGGKLPIGAMLTGWQMIGGRYFYFYSKRVGKHAEGAMLTGELFGYAGHDYRCWSAGEDKKKQTGEMVTGWYKDGKSGKYYWYNTIDTKDMPLGAMYKNKWLKLPEAWYYFKDNGEMACDETLVIGGKKYMFGKNGYMQQNE